MGVELNGALKETSNTDNLVVAEEANVDEAITANSKARNEMDNNLNDEQNTKSYEEQINIDIAYINTIEKRITLYKK